VEKDKVYGQGVIDAMRPFVEHLIEKKLKKKTYSVKIRLYLTNDLLLQYNQAECHAKLCQICSIVKYSI